jgi:DNA invertase Pin-like site-specific DNA recombinase
MRCACGCGAECNSRYKRGHNPKSRAPKRHGLAIEKAKGTFQRNQLIRQLYKPGLFGQRQVARALGINCGTVSRVLSKGQHVE